MTDDDADAAQQRAFEEASGTAQSPRTLPWAPNPSGRRTPEEAVRLVKAMGVLIPDDIRWVFREDMVPAGAYAAYGSFSTGQRVLWTHFYVREKIPVKVRPVVLDSDEAIVAVFAHELHELNSLRTMFTVRESIPGEEIIQLIRPGVSGNLHDEAWDAADRLVLAMRGGRPC